MLVGGEGSLLIIVTHVDREGTSQHYWLPCKRKKETLVGLKSAVLFGLEVTHLTSAYNLLARTNHTAPPTYQSGGWEVLPLDVPKSRGPEIFGELLRCLPQQEVFCLKLGNLKLRKVK